MPSGLKATATTLSACFIARPSGWPVAASHSRAVAAARPDLHAVRAEGDDVYLAAMLHRQASGLARCRVPQPSGLVVARRRESRAVRAEGHGDDGILMPHRLTQRLARGRIPQLGRVVVCRREFPAVRADLCLARFAFTLDR